MTDPAADPDHVLLRRWHEVDRLVVELLDAPATRRAALLEARCGRDRELRDILEELLRRTDDPMDDLASPLAPDAADDDDPAVFVGERFGPFQVERLVGRGGLSLVFLARRVEGGFDQRVAIKLLRATQGADLLRRFKRERSILASLAHPYIATLLDGGIAPGGRPYLVMEFVEGRPITRFCDDAGLSIRARLRLFLRVCDAVAAAHAHLVIHRDLKPSNILVMSDGSPRLLDFGIASLLVPSDGASEGALTLTGTRALSPAYASPEQIRGEPVAIASDIFQLGTLLYLMLTGALPHGDAVDSPVTLIAAVLDRTPPLPSDAVAEAGIGDTPRNRVRSALRGDLDTIIMKALRKEPQRRYGSVPELAEDIRRHLDGVPVRARADSRSYRAGRFLRRNRAPVAVSGVLFAGLIAGVAGLTVHSNRLEEERDWARIEADRAAATTAFLLDLFDLAGESGGQDTLRIGALLARGEERLDERVVDHPAIHVELLGALAMAHDRVGLTREAMRLLERRAAAVRAAYGPAHLETLLTLRALGQRRVRNSHWAQAVDVLEEALDVHRALAPEVARSDTARGLHAGVLSLLGTAYRETGRTDDALELVQQAIAIRRELPDGQTATVLRDDAARLAFVLRGLGRFEEAEDLYQEAIRLSREQVGEDPPIILNNYAALLMLMDRLEEAEQVFYEARRVFWPEDGAPAEALDALHINLALLLGQLGKHAEAVAVTREAEALLRASFPPDHWRVVRAVGQVGGAYLRGGDCESGEPILRQATELFAATLGPRHGWTASMSGSHAECLIELERFDEAERALLEVRPILLAERDPPGVAIQLNLEALVRLYERTGRPAEAERFRLLLPPPAP
jgi:eukaryotic-like serine/threonine-protein kinase